MARLIGELFASMGLLRSGHLVEARRPDLVASYVGQTGPKTRNKVLQARDGVLFIDEAYSLTEGGMNDFGPEAIAELVAMMEEHRERLVVIAAGYADRMEYFLRANEGLASRFSERVFFPDYSKSELVEILEREAELRNFTFAEGTVRRAALWLHERRGLDPAAFGNAREVRVLLDKMERRLGQRIDRLLAKDPAATDSVDVFTLADVPRTQT